MTARVSSETASVAADVRSGSPERFGYSWDSLNDLSEHQEEQFRRWTAHFDPADWRGKTFLDVGCGSGRNSYWPMTYGAAASRSIDVDERSLAAARRNLAAYPTAKVEFASAYEIDEEGIYDIVFSIGVIHHLAEPRLALEQMVRAAKPGGKVLIWVYGYENMGFYVNVLNPIRKALFSRMPLRLLHQCSYIPTLMLWLLLRLGVTPIEYFKLLRTIPYRHLHQIVFDQLLPKIARYWTRRQVEDLMRQSGLQEVELTWVNEMSWSAVGTKKS